MGDNWSVMRALDRNIVDLVCLSPGIHTSNLDDWNTPLSAMFTENCWAWSSETARYRNIIGKIATYDEDYAVLRQCLDGFDSLLLYATEGKNGGMRDLLTFFCPRIVEAKKLLKPSGSLYFVSFVFTHYIKCFLDTLFEQVGNNEIEHSKSEIIIEEQGSPEYRGLTWPNTHRVSLYYSNSNSYTFNAPKTQFGSVWRGFGTRNKKDEEIPFRCKSPNNLFDRWISVSSNVGDKVLDPFCGSGTTLDSAHAQGRDWIGIDIAEDAIQSTIYRMWKKHSLKPVDDYDFMIEENNQLNKIPNSLDIKWFLEKNKLGIDFSEMFK